MKRLKQRLYFFSDLDGTLLHKQSSRLFPNVKNEHVIQNFIGSGHSFIMATGRGYPDVQTVAHNINIPIEYAITYNGAIIYKNREEIFSNTLTSDQITNVLSVVEQLKLNYNEIALFVDNGDMYVKNRRVIDTIYRLGAAFKNKRKIKVWKEKTIDTLIKKNLRFPKLCFIIYNREAVSKLEKDLKAAFGNQLSIYCSSPYCLEICDAFVDKAKAIELIINRENLAADQVAFIGDSGNDICALETFDHAYLMEHASKEYKISDVKKVKDVATAILDFNRISKSEEQDVAEIDD